MLAAWSGVVRDRGRVMRFKDKIFYRWRRHIPVFKKLNKLKREGIVAGCTFQLSRPPSNYPVVLSCSGRVDTTSQASKVLRCYDSNMSGSGQQAQRVITQASEGSIPLCQFYLFFFSPQFLANS